MMEPSTDTIPSEGEELYFGQGVPWWISLREGRYKYIRTLVEDLARALGTVGFCAQLRRLWVTPFADQPMVTLDEP